MKNNKGELIEGWWIILNRVANVRSPIATMKGLIEENNKNLGSN
jgi:hypothetical protein